MLLTRFAHWLFLAGIVVLTGEVTCLRGSALVAELKAKAKAALLNPTEVVPIEELLGVDGDDAVNGTSVNNTEAVNKTRSLLTGNPQKDYIYDPNLPRELNGYNLSTYPFYNSVPEDIEFKCDDLHDGFYASVPHKCQVYHHCLFGTRYDFLCANYTAFDQKTFICHFVSEVDCDNSPKYYQRNEALYKAASTTSVPIPQTPRQTTLPPPTTTTDRPRRRRPYHRRRPVYDYYYDDQYDEEYYDDEPPPPRRKMNRKHRPQGVYRNDEDDYSDGRRDSSRGESSRTENARGEGSRNNGRDSSSGDSSQEPEATLRISGPAAGTVYDRPRVPPKIRRPVPIHERDKYDYTTKSSEGGSNPTLPSKKGKPQPEPDDDEYYDEEYEDDYVKPPPKRGKSGSEYSMESSGKSDSRRTKYRQRPRQHSRRRPEHYEDEYEDERPVKPRKRIRHEDAPHTGRGTRGGYRGFSRDEPDPVPADRPGFISSGRFSPSNRKRGEDDRAPMTSKKQYTRVVYDDEEDEEEYYDDDDEEDIHEDDENVRHHQHSSNSRRSDDYDQDRRKLNNPNRKQSSESKQNSQVLRNERRSQTNEQSQGSSLRNGHRKPSNKQTPEQTPFSGGYKDEQCRNNCDDDYSDEPNGRFKQGQREINYRDRNVKETNEQENQRQRYDVDRLFSSRFKDQNESKSKEPKYDGQSRTSTTPASYRPTTESSHRYKPSLRGKTTSDETLTITSSTLVPTEDYSDEILTPKYSNFRSKGRIVPPTPLINNYKSVSTTEETIDTSKISDTNPEISLETSDSTESEYSATNKPFSSPRPLSSITWRPIKQSAELANSDEILVTPKTSDSKSDDFTNTQPSVLDRDDLKPVRKPVSFGQNYRRIKTDTPQTETVESFQPKLPYSGNGFRRPIKSEETFAEDSTYSKETEETVNADAAKGNKPLVSDKNQSGGPNYGGIYRRVKVSTVTTPVTESDTYTTSYENSQPVDVTSTSNPVNSNKRPFVVVRPLSKNPVVVEETPKNVVSPITPFRKLIKQRVENSETLSVPEDTSPSVTGDTNENVRKPDSNLSPGNLRQNYGYFPPKRGKVRHDENSGRGLEQYPKQRTLNQEDQYTPKQLSKIEITAPGPSAPDLDIATVKANYNSGSAGFPLNIPEEEYDVTLNDALQPSTLHPTRSLVDYQQTRLKPRDYQQNAGQGSEYVNRGRVSYLLPAASQQVQNVFVPEEVKKDPEEYEAVVLTDRWRVTQRRNTPTEWFW